MSNTTATKFSSLAGMNRTEMRATLTWAFKHSVDAEIKGNKEEAAGWLKMATEIAAELKA